MTARRSTSDPVSPYLETGERVVWRHQPDGHALFFSRIPSVIFMLVVTAFLVFVAFNTVSTATGPLPVQLDLWLILTAAVGLFFLVLLFVFLRALWNHVGSLLDSWSTHYALTDKRFLVVSNRGVADYDASYFGQMEAFGDEPGRQTLLFDYGPFGKHRRNSFRQRIAMVPDAKKLEQLIRETLHA